MISLIAFYDIPFYVSNRFQRNTANGKDIYFSSLHLNIKE